MDARKQSFDLASRRVGALPIVNRYLEQLRVESLLAAHLEPADPRAALPAEKVLMVLLRNLIVERHPLYAVGAWADSLLPQVAGLPGGGGAKLNDDRIGRALDRLFDADRVSMLTELVLHMIEAFAIDTGELHNDSTTLTLHGAYRQADGRPMRGKPAAEPARGHSKDYRPDLKQLLWILTVSSDGGVPVHFKVSSGNTEDSTTHIETWNRLRGLVGRADFMYVADSKLCTLPNMRHIDDGGGRFITVMPRSRKEDGLFRQWLLAHSPAWEPIAERPHPRLQDGPPDVIMAMESPVADPHGFRILWYFSSHKFKNVLEATPAYLKNIGRLEALLFLEFIALIAHALIERTLRRHMRNERIESLPLYPEMRACKAPTTDRLLALFAPVQHHRLSRGGVPVQEFPPELDELQKTMIELAGLEPTLYQDAVAEKG